MTPAARIISRLQILGISLATLNLVFWCFVPAIRGFVDETTGRWANANNPKITNGMQELMVYFDPWLAVFVFPVIYTLGFAAIPFLKKPDEAQTHSRQGGLYSIVVSLLLVSLDLVWLALIAVEIFLRGPNWNIFWPGEKWDANKIVPTNRINLSDYFWREWSGQAPQNGMAWELRELPGLVFTGLYLLAGVFVAYCLFRVARRITPYWRWMLLVLLVQLAALVPIKVFLHCVFNLKYLIYIPEYFCNL